jgi:hypothetical protein
MREFILYEAVPLKINILVCVGVLFSITNGFPSIKVMGYHFIGK